MILGMCFLIVPAVADDEKELEFKGLAYGAYRGAGPDQGEQIVPSNVREDMTILRNLGCKFIRTYGSGLNQKIIPGIADEFGITTYIGAWISSDSSSNNAEINLAIESSVTSEDIIIVGNEVLLRGDLSKAELISLFAQVKSQGFQVAYADTYGIWLNNPDLADLVDLILAHIYPFWDGQGIENAAEYTIEKFDQVQAAFPSREIIIGECGWPSDGNSRATIENQNKYYQELLPLLFENSIKAFLFSAFDEDWKSEGGVGPHWGIFKTNRSPKPSATVVAEWFGGTVSTPETPDTNDDKDDTEDPDFEILGYPMILVAFIFIVTTVVIYKKRKLRIS